jgi:prevent-host-death family protein
MSTKYSIADARQNLASIVHELDKKEYIELTRRGEPVAVLLSIHAYRRLAEPQIRFSDAYRAFRKKFPVSEDDAELIEFDDVRDRSPGREVNL